MVMPVTIEEPSITIEEPPIRNGEAPASRKPSNSAFKQQKLPAWQPILTAGTVLPTLFIIGIAFIPIGIVLLTTSNKVIEIPYDYTYCNSSSHPGKTCVAVLESGETECTCKISLNIEKTIEGNVFLYYRLTNYYQNHRRYVKSRDDAQLLGDLSDTKGSDYCIPFHIDPETKMPIAPCGAIANSLFNDEISLYKEATNVPVPLLKRGIAWPTDKIAKFKNPKGLTLKDAFNGTAKPINWTRPVYELDPDDEQNNGFQNEDLIVWMRTAALPTFRKLYRRVNHTEVGYEKGLPQGWYDLVIKYRYKVTPFKGTKSIILSNTSWLGGKNSFLGIAYIVVGSLCLLMAVAFLTIHIKWGKSAREMVNISQRTHYRQEGF